MSAPLQPHTPIRVAALVGLFALLTALASASVALACGGFFCTTATINQQVERIIFTQSGAAISAYVQINYTGPEAEFAWVVPVPSVPEVAVVSMTMFTELDTLTAPIIIPPPVPEWCPVMLAAVAEGVGGGEVIVFSSGEVGPYGYDVIGSEDSQALIEWLKTNGYQITPAMEPLVQVYVNERMLFLAMKLRPGAGVQDIQPVKMSYLSERPMIPLRLTAVAANPNMGVLVWLLGDTQYESDNYAKLEIADSELQFAPFGFGGSNYFLLRTQKIDAVNGQGFITEYAGPTSGLVAVDPDLQDLLRRYPYATRMYTEISPEEMTVDPMFRYNAALPNVSNVRDLSQMPYDYGCGTPPPDTSVDARAEATAAPNIILPAVGGQPDDTETAARAARTWLLTIAIGGPLVGLLLLGAFLARRRSGG